MAGDHLKSRDGRRLVLDAVECGKGTAPVYNLRVAEYHTYFVGGQTWGFSVWAHNVDCGELYAFGSKEKPRGPRPGKDIDIDEDGFVYPAYPPGDLRGGSLVGDIEQTGLIGPCHKIPKDTTSDHITIIPDGSDVGGPRGPTYHTAVPSYKMTYDDYVKHFLSLGWEYAGNKKAEK